jgi:hypothetical protein
VLLLLGAALTGRGMETDLPATGDYAALELYTRLAAQGRQLLGPYSRFGFHHPGPAYFYACRCTCSPESASRASS